VLLVLAYLTILHLPEPPRVLLVEEPENGIHPKRLADVLKILRDLIGQQSRTQVILTTHSPYVLDLFEPGEVSLCQKQQDGSVRVRRLSESDVVDRLGEVFTLGEIWTSEGDAALVTPLSGTNDSEAGGE
jgi:predicted ATPase